MRDCFDNNFKTQLLNNIRVVENYPKEGILFRDITTLLNNGELFNDLINRLAEYYRDYAFDFIAGIESRGFIFGSALACALKKGFVPIRKKGKLPHKTFQKEYLLEYGSDIVEIHQDAFLGISDARVLLIDDLIATGGTAKAAEELIAMAGGKCVESCFLINLKELSREARLESKIFSILEL